MNIGQQNKKAHQIMKGFLIYFDWFIIVPKPIQFQKLK